MPAPAVYELQGVGRDGQAKYFQKPWAMTCVMFLGMSCCLPLAYYQQAQRRKKRADTEAEEPLLLNGEARTLRQLCWVLGFRDARAIP